MCLKKKKKILTTYRLSYFLWENMKRRKQIRRVKTTALNLRNGVADGDWEEKTVE